MDVTKTGARHLRNENVLKIHAQFWLSGIRGQIGQIARKYKKTFNINTHAVGMAPMRPYGFKISFVRNPISWSAVFSTKNYIMSKIDFRIFI